MTGTTACLARLCLASVAEVERLAPAPHQPINAFATSAPFSTVRPVRAAEAVERRKAPAPHQPVNAFATSATSSTARPARAAQQTQLIQQTLVPLHLSKLAIAISATSSTARPVRAAKQTLRRPAPAQHQPVNAFARQTTTSTARHPVHVAQQTLILLVLV